MQERDVSRNRKITVDLISTIPLIRAGDNLPVILGNALEKENFSLQDGDILVVAQKVISKAEGQTANLNEYIPGKQAIEISQKSGRDQRLLQAMIEESKEIIRVVDGTPESPGVIVTRHRLGHVCTSAGIDKSNTGFTDKDIIILLPENPDRSAREIAGYFDKNYKVKIGVVIVDSLGDPYRMGAIGKAIGVANIPARLFEKDLEDLDKKQAKADIAFADSIASFAMILMGQTDQRVPVVLIKGVKYPLTPTAKIQDVLI